MVCSIATTSKGRNVYRRILELRDDGHGPGLTLTCFSQGHAGQNVGNNINLQNSGFL